MNVVMISPNFPDNYWHFCDRLRRNGCNVFGIGDAPYDGLSDELKSSVTEYYKVDSLENYDQVYRAVAYFTFKYGRIDWIESNNEYWLGQDAMLREDYNILSGVWPHELSLWKSKSSMKPVYHAAGIPTARNHRVTDIEAARTFINECGGYPVFAKPDVGVGASDTFKICSDEDLDHFFAVKPDEQYVMEEFVVGDVYSYDAISDSKGNILFESCFKCPNVAESVNDNKEVLYYVRPDVPEQLREYGRKAIAGFKVRSRFTHFEFFCLTEARQGLGEVGDFVGLEVNMRPAGGYTPDMINFAHSCDVYQMWADMVAFDEIRHQPDGADRFCMFTGQKDSYAHTHSAEDIRSRYGGRIMMEGRMPDIFAAAMGNYMHIMLCDSMEEVREAGEYILDDVSYLL
jgi:hypothetical protein